MGHFCWWISVLRAATHCHNARVATRRDAVFNYFVGNLHDISEHLLLSAPLPATVVHALNTVAAYDSLLQPTIAPSL